MRRRTIGEPLPTGLVITPSTATSIITFTRGESFPKNNVVDAVFEAKILPSGAKAKVGWRLNNGKNYCRESGYGGQTIGDRTYVNCKVTNTLYNNLNDGYFWQLCRSEDTLYIHSYPRTDYESSIQYYTANNVQMTVECYLVDYPDIVAQATVLGKVELID